MIARAILCVLLAACCGDDAAGPDATPAPDAMIDARAGRSDASSSECPYVCPPGQVPACTIDPAGACTCTCETL